MKRCRVCGKTCGDALITCPSCGGTLETSTHTRCSRCGRENDDAFIACPFCGAKTDEKTQWAKPHSESARTSYVAKKPFLKKVETFEKSKHFIVNGLVALFSLLLFLLTIFAGAEVNTMMDMDGDPISGEGIAIRQNTFQLLTGALSIFERDTDKMEAYLEEANEKFAVAFEEALEKYEKEIEKNRALWNEIWAQETPSKKQTDKLVKEEEKLTKKIFSYAAAKSDYNVLKVRYYTMRLYEKTEGGVASTMVGGFLAVALSAVLLAALITTLVFGILAVLALVRQRETVRPYRAFIAALSLFFAAYALAALNPIARATGVLTAAAVLSVVGMVLLGVVRRFLLDAQAPTANSIVRGGVSLLCSLIALFLLCGTLFTIKVETLSTTVLVKGSIGTVIRQFINDGASTFGVRDSASGMWPYAVIFWIVANILTIRCVAAACYDLYTGKDEMKNNNGKSNTMGLSIGAAVLTALSLGLYLIIFGKSQLGVGLSGLFALLLLITSAAVKYTCKGK